MRSVRDIPTLENIPVLVRTSLNVPIENGVVANDYRLRRALPTIHYLAERGARVVLISHIGRKDTETLKPVADALGKLTHHVSFCPVTVGSQAREAVRTLPAGHILVMENLRRAKGEKDNDLDFAKELAALGDVFVEDSFDTCHRAHASIVRLPGLLPAYAGLQLLEEVEALSDARKPVSPSLAVIGGAKFLTKEAVLKTLLETYDTVFVGGALANDFLKAQGHEVGKSLVSDNLPDDIVALLKDEKLRLPLDARVSESEHATSPTTHDTAREVVIAEVGKDDVIMDAGPKTSELLAQLAGEARTILWNGPLGNYEHGFVDATDALARATAASQAHSVVGGGDTIASIESLNLLPKFSFVSTGGGAMLDFLTHGSLPGIDALES